MKDETDQTVKIKRVISESIPEPPPHTYSNCLVAGNQVFISGMLGVSYGSENDIDTYTQAKNAFEKIKELMEKAGGSMADIVKLNTYLTDLNDSFEFWRARKEFFKGNFPTGTMVEVSKLGLGAKVEIEAIGLIGAGEKQGIEEDPAEKRTMIQIDPILYDQYVGQYELGLNQLLTVFKENHLLFAQLTGLSKIAFFPESEKSFFSTLFDSQIFFVKNDKNETVELILYQEGKETIAKKIK